MDQEKSRPGAASAAPAAERASLRDHPIGFWFFFWGEFAERCCYYGMRAILLLFMIQVLNFDDGKASQVQSYFMAACYLLPLVGGFVADNYLGKYRTIVYFSIPYILGQAILGIAALHNETCLYFSLGLLAMGTGVIKPNISTLMGLTYDQQRPGRSKLRSDAFAMFYGAINIGAAISSFCVPWIRTALGGNSRAYAIAFLFPAALMILAFIVFASGKRFYAEETIRRTRPTPEERKQRWVVLGRLFGLFAVVTVFWSIYDQSVSTWVLFTRDYLDLNEFGILLSPDQIQSINPVLVVLLLPPITLLWHWLSSVGLNLKPTSKMLIGFVLTGATMAIIAWAGYYGAAVAKSRAPEALASVEKVAQAAMQAADDPTANAAVEQMMAACAAQRTAADDGKGSDAAEKLLKSADGAVQKAAPVTVTSAGAVRAAAAATRAARASYAVVGSQGDIREAAAKEAATAGKTALAAADAAKKIIKLAAEAAKERDSVLQSRLEKISPQCSAAANRAADAASAAAKAAEASTGADDVAAAEVHAAVASLAAADSATAAMRAAAEVQDATVPAVVSETEAAAAAARISLLWQLIPYVIITIAEICISVVGLELAFAAAPASMKSFVTACWLLTVTFGNILNAQITPLYNTTVAGYCLLPGPYFLAFALLMIPVTAAFMFFARRFNDGTAA